ncbi:hypothetical protein H634G_11331 [Metarhizium anisopliae BRIP 53293]|uniref:Uncharacterized protein n=1 Tax=Metarhizium anisopliae BRIP 53293 TaxID=1291518 RepID=A0A0D9NHJ0_METAN|nr:hypothetical protein H634G_11331 [Metarhizium anisopliae BRIP 53293]
MPLSGDLTRLCAARIFEGNSSFRYGWRRFSLRSLMLRVPGLTGSSIALSASAISAHGTLCNRFHTIRISDEDRPMPRSLVCNSFPSSVCLISRRISCPLSWAGLEERVGGRGV